MTKEDIVKHLRQALFAAQKFRSNHLDMGGTEMELQMLYPWLTGERNIVNSLDRILEHHDATGRLEMIDVYNIAVIIDSFLPCINAQLIMLGAPTFPIPREFSIRLFEVVK